MRVQLYIKKPLGSSLEIGLRALNLGAHLICVLLLETIMKRRMRLIVSAFVLSGLISGCGSADSGVNSHNEAAVSEASVQGASLDAGSGNVAQPHPRFSSKRLHSSIETLSSDAFGGRMPGTRGEELTINFLAEQFKALGVQAGNGDSFFQTVKLVSVESDPAMAMSLSFSDGEQSLEYGSEFMGGTQRIQERTELAGSELVFVGYGVVAPEYDWNDYEGLDMTGKTAVILVNDPGYATQNDALFKGNTMTYYGRWSYKYEEAARQGAAGAIIVHETGAAGYPWAVVSGSWSGLQHHLFAEDRNMSATEVEAWVTTEVATSIFAKAGFDFAALKQAAQAHGFKPQALGVNMSLAFDNKIESSNSSNVVGLIEGSERPDETIIYTAHWDHLGTRSGEGDQIFNGAVDNATGTAALIELAAAYKAMAEAPKRSVVFLAVTAEESGLLGSKFYSENPIYPLASTVAAINMDASNVLGRTRDITVVGYGASELDEYLRTAADKQNRVLVREPTPEKGYYYRSDHFNFAKKGVPALYAEGGVDYLGRPEGWGLEQQADYTDKRYHKPADEYDPSWDLSGMLEDMSLYFDIGYQLANGDDFPKWSPGSEFKAIREASRTER